MGGINLSQSIQEKQAIARGRIFDKGFFINLSILILVLILYGGSQWYISRLTNELSTLQQTSIGKTATLTNEKVNRIADFRNRADMIVQELQHQDDPSTYLSELEQAMLPTIRLKDYRFVREDNLLTLTGVAQDFRSVAQEMLALKKLSQTVSIHTDKIGYNSDHELEFSFQIAVQGIQGSKMK